jgi:hypothetical protein
LKKLIYGNSKIQKPIKRVQFKGLPPMEEDEKKKKLLPKDAPKGVEDINLTLEENEGVAEEGGGDSSAKKTSPK